uniref:trafficking kinesin-binding protein 2-like isoform X4 n=1 Tax=Styela clava TaxID=7725 RepID=UPI00193A8A6B|nr:trafficking kinesin-binding protein 2-like isoform X4 [Styela clava]
MQSDKIFVHNRIGLLSAMNFIQSPNSTRSRGSTTTTASTIAVSPRLPSPISDLEEDNGYKSWENAGRSGSTESESDLPPISSGRSSASDVFMPPPTSSAVLRRRVEKNFAATPVSKPRAGSGNPWITSTPCTESAATRTMQNRGQKLQIPNEKKSVNSSLNWDSVDEGRSSQQLTQEDCCDHELCECQPQLKFSFAINCDEGSSVVHSTFSDVESLSEEDLKFEEDEKVLSGDRLSQMTRTYHDIEAVTHLLEEKERDLELAARIGQTLLQKNRDIVHRNEQLEEQLAGALEEVSQLRHEISLKEDLLHTYADDETDSSGAPSPVKELKNFGRTGMYNHIESLHNKIRKLESENGVLKVEKVQAQSENEALESEEQQLVSDAVKELNALREELREARDSNKLLQEELLLRNEESVRQQEEITRLLTQIVDMQRKQKQLALENEELQQHLTAANNTQYELTREIQALEDRYQEVTNMLDETREEARILRDNPEHYGRTVPFSDSLAAELECSGGMSAEMNFQDFPQPNSFYNPLSGSIEWSSPPSSVVDEDNDIENISPDTRETLKLSRYTRSEPRIRSRRDETFSQRVLNTARFVNNVKNFSMNSKFQYTTPKKQDRPIPTPLPIPGSNRLPCFIHQASPESGQSSGLTTPSLGRPGIPGTEDLERAIRKLALRRENARYMELDRRLAMNDESFNDLCGSGNNTPWSSMPSGGQTPPPSCPSSPKGSRKKYRYGPGSSLAPKLRIVKPLEGSVTLNHWKFLAERDRLLTLQPRSDIPSGIITRERVAEALSRSRDGNSSNSSTTESKTSSNETPLKSSIIKMAFSGKSSGSPLCMTTAFPMPISSSPTQKESERSTNDDVKAQQASTVPINKAPEISPIRPGKQFPLTLTQYTYINSRVMNPTHESTTTPLCSTSTQQSVSSSVSSRSYLSSIHPFLSGQTKKQDVNKQPNKFIVDNTRTCSMQLGLAHLFKEHSVNGLPPPEIAPATSSIVTSELEKNGDVESPPLLSNGEKSAFTLTSNAETRSSAGHVVWNRSLQRTFLLPSSLPTSNILFNLNRRSDSRKPETPPNSPLTNVPSSSSFLLNEIISETTSPTPEEPQKEEKLFSSNLLSKLAQIGWMGLQGFAGMKTSTPTSTAKTSHTNACTTISSTKFSSPRNSISKCATAPGSLLAKDSTTPTSTKNSSRLSLNIKTPSTDQGLQMSPAVTDWAELHGSSGALNLPKGLNDPETDISDGYLDEVSDPPTPKSDDKHSLPQTSDAKNLSTGTDNRPGLEFFSESNRSTRPKVTKLSGTKTKRRTAKNSSKL